MSNWKMKSARERNGNRFSLERTFLCQISSFTLQSAKHRVRNSYVNFMLQLLPFVPIFSSIMLNKYLDCFAVNLKPQTLTFKPLDRIALSAFLASQHPFMYTYTFLYILFPFMPFGYSNPHIPAARQNNAKRKSTINRKLANGFMLNTFWRYAIFYLHPPKESA